MDSLEELLLIPGVSQAMYFAEPAKKVEPPIPPFSELLTVHGNPEGRVNVNTAPVEVLDAMFAVASAAGGVTATADQVMQRLKTVGPYTSRKELQAEGVLPTPRRQAGGANPGQAQDAQEAQDDTPEGSKPPDLFDVRSSVFRIRGDSQTGDVSVRVEAYIWRDTAQEDAPGQQAGSGAAQMFRIIDWRVLS
jgi:type II secretory pathway component PulK